MPTAPTKARSSNKGAEESKRSIPLSDQPPAPTDQDLMRRIAEQKDQTAFATLVDRYRQKLFATCYRMLGQYAEAEEAVQDSFLKLWNYAPSWDVEKASLSTWLYTITSNTCRDVLRKRKAILVEHDDNRESDLPGGQQVVEQKQQARLVKKAINKLPDRQREALVLSYYQGLSHKEIGAVMSTSPKSIEGLIARARTDLKQQLSFLSEAL
ncbi:MAG: RNA polymerase sigma factor [Pseudomonadota bacterium]